MKSRFREANLSVIQLQFHSSLDKIKKKERK